MILMLLTFDGKEFGFWSQLPRCQMPSAPLTSSLKTFVEWACDQQLPPWVVVRIQ